MRSTCRTNRRRGRSRPRRGRRAASPGRPRRRRNRSVPPKDRAVRRTAARPPPTAGCGPRIPPLERGAVDRARAPGSPQVHEHEVTSLHQRPEEPEVPVPRRDRPVPRPAFDGDDRAAGRPIRSRRRYEANPTVSVPSEDSRASTRTRIRPQRACPSARLHGRNVTSPGAANPAAFAALERSATGPAPAAPGSPITMRPARAAARIRGRRRRGPSRGADTGHRPYGRRGRPAREPRATRERSDRLHGTTMLREALRCGAGTPPLLASNEVATDTKPPAKRDDYVPKHAPGRAKNKRVQKKKGFLRRRWWLLVLLTPVALGIVGAVAFADRLHRDRAPEPTPADPDHLRLRPRRGADHHAARCGRSHGRVHLGDLPTDARCGDRHRRPRLLPALGLRSGGRPAGRLDQLPGHRQRGPGRLHDHAAGREEHLRGRVRGRPRDGRCRSTSNPSVPSRRRSARSSSR